MFAALAQNHYTKDAVDFNKQQSSRVVNLTLVNPYLSTGQRKNIGSLAWLWGSKKPDPV
jgi:hypothetical protein